MQKQFKDLTLAEKKKLLQLNPGEIKALLKELGDVVDDPKSTPKEVSAAVTKIEEVKTIKETPKDKLKNECDEDPATCDCSWHENMRAAEASHEDLDETLQIKRDLSFRIW
jgi:hypothetical protein